MDHRNKVIPFPVKETEESQDSQEYGEVRLVRVSSRMREIFSEDLEEENAEGSIDKHKPVKENDKV